MEFIAENGGGAGMRLKKTRAAFQAQRRALKLAKPASFSRRDEQFVLCPDRKELWLDRQTEMGHGSERADENFGPRNPSPHWRVTMSLRRLAGLMLAPMILMLVQILRFLVRALRRQGQEGPEWRRMMRARIAFGLLPLSYALLNLSGVVGLWLED